MMSRVIKRNPKILSFFLVAFLRLYQKAVSPYLNRGACCKFYPTCSEYAVLAIQKYGVFTGGLKAFLRILRCNPFAKRKVDFP